MLIRAAGKRSRFEIYLDGFIEDLKLKNYSLSTLHARRLVLEQLARFLEARRLRDPRRVTEEHLFAWASWLPQYETKYRAPLSIASQRYWISTARAFFAFLELRDLILRNPAADLQMPKVDHLPRGVLSEEQARKLMAAPNPWTSLGLRDRAMLEVFYGAGLRLSECLNLDVSDIDLSRRVIVVRLGKGRKDRVVPLGGRAADAVDKYLQGARPQLVRDSRVSKLFLSMRGRRLTQTTLSEAMAGYGRQAGISWRVSPHVLRHTFATHLLKRGADVRHVQRLLGHAAIETTQIYTRVAVKDLHDVIERSHPRDKYTLPELKARPDITKKRKRDRA